MKVYILLTLCLTTVLAKRCYPNYHYWRPYYGTIPDDAFVAGVDADGTRSYVAKIIPLDKDLWTVPVQIKENHTKDYLDFSWCCGDDKPRMKVSRFIEILCTENADKLLWQRVNENIGEASSNCCLVESGIALHYGQILYSHIGKAERDDEVFIGRAYSVTPGLNTMNGTTPIKFMEDFEALVYDCTKLA